MKFLHPLFLLFFFISAHAQDSTKKFIAVRTSSAPRIDGLLDDDAWKNIPAVSDFIQALPTEGEKVSQKTEIKIIYDDAAIYVGAMMYDVSPDSILQELGNRDDDGLNADKFRVVIDPYNSQLDAYEFGVYASGVQTDMRFSDITYNAVWQSAVKILKNGWSVELKIPYSAIRFPSSIIQKWGLQLTRDVRRTREFDQWCLTPADKANPQKFWGTLEGISDIKPPLRLSLTPYVSGYYETAPAYNPDGTYNYANSFSYNAGADLKYGLDERYTLDMTLLPDFGQIKSDDKVKNLSYREVNYEDNRPFFKEGTDLFNQDEVFYSRRIGKTPTLFYDVPGLIDSGETIVKNPSQAKLLNATKISGRGNSGLGFGLFNAVTDNTYAEIKNSEGKTRKILTEPLTNYNAFVFDQQMKNSSSTHIINTNVIRSGKDYRDANVTSSGIVLRDKSNTYQFNGGGALSQLFTKNDSVKNIFTDQMGYYYFAALHKISGTWQYGIGHESMSKTYDRSDMGYQSIGNFSAIGVNFSYNRLKPWRSVLRSFNSLNAHYSYYNDNRRPSDLSFNLNSFVLFKSYLSIFGGGGFAPFSNYDYNEPRVEGRYFRTAQYWFAYMGVSTDYRKKLAFDLNINTSNWIPNNIHDFPQGQGLGFEVKPRIRISDKLSVFCGLNYNFDPFNPGFVDSTGGVITFGARKLNTYITTLSAKYIFKNDLSFTLNGRHYWNTGEYIHYYTLLGNGLLAANTTYTENNNFSYNAFTLDATFSWQFAPGSIFSVVYKNVIDNEGFLLPKNYADNFSQTFQLPQTNSISIKVLYYLDYQQIKKRKE